jgi:hypothetical protein
MFTPITDTFSGTPDYILGYLNNSLVMVPVTKGPGGPLPPGTGFGQGASGDLTTLTAQLNALDTLLHAPSTGEIPVLTQNLASLSGSLTALGETVGTNSSAITALQTTLTALTAPVTGTLAVMVAQEASDIAALQAQIDSLDIVNPGAITGLTGGALVDMASVFTSFVGPAEESGSIVAADGVISRVPAADAYLIGATVDVDPQVSMYWDARGGTVIIPGPRIPALTLGTYGTSTRTGGGAPGSLFRLVRRASGINKQAFEQMIGGFCIDGTGVKANGTFTSNGTTTITATGHGRLVNDIVFFGKSASGAGLPTGLTVGDASKITDSFKILSATTNTFTVAAWNVGLGTYDSTAVTVGAGAGQWSTNVAGLRIPNCQPSNTNDCDQDFDNRKNYTAGLFRDIDVNNMSGSGLVSEAGSGRLHLHNARFIGNRLHGADIASNDTVFSGHWAAGSNGQWGIHKGSGTGLYATTGNVWGSPGNRSPICGGMQLSDTAYYAIGFTEFNDWFSANGDANFNAAGCLNSNMFHPHAENFSSDGVAINVYNDGDVRLQSNVAVQGYQGFVLFGNAWSRTETVQFDTPGNFGGDQVMVSGKSLHGTAPKYLAYFGAYNTNKAMAQIFDGVCTAPNVKPWQGPFATITTDATNGVNWVGHPLMVGDRVFFHGACGGLTADSVEYYVVDTATDSFHVSATYGGSPITMTVTSGGTCFQRNSCPYYISGSAQLAGVYADSYRGIVKLWSVNGFQAKFMIGTSVKTQPWEGNPNYYCEIGSTDLAGGLPLRNVLYGQWEHDKAWGYTDNAFNAKQITTSGHTIGAGTAVQFYTTSAGATIATATITLPTDLTQTRPLDVIFSSGGCTALSWTVSGGGSINTSTVQLPSTWLGAMLVRLMFRRDTNSWFVVSVTSAADPYITNATVTGTVATDCSKGRNFQVGPITGNITLSNPSNSLDGVEYTWVITQDGTGGRTLTYGTKFKAATADAASNLNTAANGRTLIKAKRNLAADTFDVISFKSLP